MDKHHARFEGRRPKVPPWGQEQVYCSPDLARRLPECSPRRPEVCVVFGAGGALGPDVVHALRRRVAVVIGVDKQLTYWVNGVVYRAVDLGEGAEVRAFFRDVRAHAQACGLRMGPCFDLATIQTSATDGADRGALVAGKRALLDALCEAEEDATLVYMSTAEVYGAPAGAPYAESHEKAPINVYGRHKHREEAAMLSAHGRATAGGHLRVVALRTWTISMVNYDASGRITATRNYNDPMIALAEKLARAGIRLPVPDPDLWAQFHPSEEVAEVLVRLGEQPQSRESWGRAYNCIGQPTTHGRMRDICYEVFYEGTTLPWWTQALGQGVRLVAPAVARTIGVAARWAHRSKRLGATRFGERLPFLYRSTHIDNRALQALLGDVLHEPKGSASERAVRALCQGLRRGGPDALNLKRYAMY